MAGQMRLRPLSLTLLLLGAFILVVFQSYHSLTPKAIQFIQGNTLKTREVAPDTLSSEIFDGGSNLHARQAINDDYTCAVGRPCKNGACCGSSGNCGYGEYRRSSLEQEHYVELAQGPSIAEMGAAPIVTLLLNAGNLQKHLAKLAH
jgi:hypothetical protein